MNLVVGKNVSRLHIDLQAGNETRFPYSATMEGNEKEEVNELKDKIEQLELNLRTKQARLDEQEREITEQRRKMVNRKMSMIEERSEREEIKGMLASLQERITKIDQADEKGWQRRGGEEESEAAAKSRRHRGLVSGLNKTLIAKQFPKRKKYEDMDLETIESNIRQIMDDEDRHRASNPRAGAGYYYLQGHTPFWREPWPRNWKVTTPWEFENETRPSRTASTTQNSHLGCI